MTRALKYIKLMGSFIGCTLLFSSMCVLFFYIFLFISPNETAASIATCVVSIVWMYVGENCISAALNKEAWSLEYKRIPALLLTIYYILWPVAACFVPLYKESFAMYWKDHK